MVLRSRWSFTAFIATFSLIALGGLIGATGYSTDDQLAAGIDNNLEQTLKLQMDESGWRQEDAGWLESRHEYASDILSELLKREALEQLARTAYTLAALSDSPLSDSPLFRISVPEQRFPGLASELRALQKTLGSRFSRLEDRQAFRAQASQLLVLAAVQLQQLEKERDDLLQSRRKAMKLKDTEEVEKDEKSIAVLEMVINELLSSSPVMLALFLNADGPPALRPTDDPLLAFDFTSPDRSLYWSILSSFDRGEKMSEVVARVSASLPLWLPAWNGMILEARYAIELRSLQELFRHQSLLTRVLQDVPPNLSQRLTRYADRKQVDFGYQPDDGKHFARSDSSRLRSNLELAGFFASRSAGAVLAISNGVWGMFHQAADKIWITAGGFLGWNDYESVRVARMQSTFRPLLIGAANAVFGYVLRSKMDRWIAGLEMRGGGTVALGILERLQAGRVAFSLASQGGPVALLRAGGGAFRSFLKANPNFVRLAIVNTVAGEASMVYSSWKQRQKGMAELLRDPNFWRDAMEEALIDSLMAFFATRNKPFLDAAFVLSSVSAVSGVISQSVSFGYVDWDRVVLHSAVLATYGCFKFRSIFAPLRDGTEALMHGLVLRAAGSTALSGAWKAADALLTNGSGFGVLLLSNMAGTFPWLILGRSLEQDDLNTILQIEKDKAKRLQGTPDTAFSQ